MQAHIQRHRTSEAILAEIEQHLGFIPFIFTAVQETPSILENLWQQTLFAYIDNPLPSEFKEKLLTYLARYCIVPYLLMHHSCVLYSWGVPASDILALIKTPAPTEPEIEQHLPVLAAQASPLTTWPEPDTPLDKTLFLCATFMFLKPHHAHLYHTEMQRVLGTEHYNYLTTLLSYVRTYHFWIETRTALAYEGNTFTQQFLVPLLKDEPELAEFFRSYQQIVRHEQSSPQKSHTSENAKLERIHKQQLENAARLQRLAETNIIGILFGDVSSVILDANEAMCTMLGYTREELLSGKIHLTELTPPEYLPRDQQAMKELAATGVCTPLEKEFIRKDGSRVPVMVGAALLTGVPMVCAVYVIDMSRRRRLEEEHRQMEQRTGEMFEALLEMAEILVQPLDTERAIPATPNTVAQQLVDMTRRVLGCHRVGILALVPDSGMLQPVAIAGFSPELERRWWDEMPLYHINDFAAGTEILNRLFANEVTMLDLTEPHLRDLPNPYGIHSVLLAPMHVGDRFTGLLTFDYGQEDHVYHGQEIALASAVAKLTAIVIERERLLQEQADARATEIFLRETKRQMDEFLSITSHELKTPLTVITSNIQFADRLLRKLQDKQDVPSEMMLNKMEEVRKLLKTADKQVWRFNQIVDDILDVSRIQTGKFRLSLRRHDLAVMVREAVEEQFQNEGSDTISLHMHPEREVYVMADANRIRQVMVNYLSNAMKYSYPGQPVVVSLHLGGTVARVSVKDEGFGIPADKCEHIWERFYRIDDVETIDGSDVTGLGVGLHLCKTFIESHSGQVGVESVVGEGSTFWFTLPLAE